MRDCITKPVDVSAPHGEPGTWVLDPRNIEIVDSSAGIFQLAGYFTPRNENSKVDVALINNALNSGTSVYISTQTEGAQEGNIKVSTPILKSAGDDTILTLEAAGDITVNNTITSIFKELGVVLKAGKDIHLNETIFTNGGDLALSAGNLVAIKNPVWTAGGNLTVGPLEAKPAHNFAHISGQSTPIYLHISGADSSIFPENPTIHIHADLETSGGDIILGKELIKHCS